MSRGNFEIVCSWVYTVIMLTEMKTDSADRLTLFIQKKVIMIIAVSCAALVHEVRVSMDFPESKTEIRVFCNVSTETMASLRFMIFRQNRERFSRFFAFL